MVKLISRIGGSAGRYVAIAALAGMLTSCGGGSGDASPIGEQDLDGDGFSNDIDDDDDGDGVSDLLDLWTDRDGDGLDDDSGLTENEALDAVEVTDGDPIDPDPVDVVDTGVCGSENGTDNNSSTNTWDDNCVVKRSIDGGLYADSLYAVGIQRVLYCTGYGEAANYGNFADGEYGELSEAAAIDFQAAEGLVADGEVGPRTWARLQSKVEVLEFGIVGSTPDTLGFTGGRCANIVMFYQDTTLAADGFSPLLGGWGLARNAPNQDERLPFSIEAPFGRL